jgi:hypothetical protein
MFSRFQNKMRPVFLEINKNRCAYFIASVVLTTTTGAGIGSIVGLYNGYRLSKYHASFTDKIKITLGGCFNGFVHGWVYCFYPLYPMLIMYDFMEEYNRAKRI